MAADASDPNRPRRPPAPTRHRPRLAAAVACLVFASGLTAGGGPGNAAVSTGSCGAVHPRLWTGAADATDWFNAGNWQGLVVPGRGDHVCVPTTTRIQPIVINRSAEIAGIEAHQPLAVTGDLVITGATRASLVDAPLLLSGRLSLGEGATIRLAAPLTNAGTLDLGPASSVTAPEYSQSSRGTLRLSLAGPNSAGGTGSLRLTGAARLGGTLTVLPTSGFVDRPALRRQLISSASVVGSFARVTGGAGALGYAAAYRSRGVSVVSTILPLLSVVDAPVMVPPAGPASAGFTVSLSTASDVPVTVDYATHDMTAKVADGDYQPASGTLTFPPGSTDQVLAVAVHANSAIEPVEGFTVTLSAAANAALNNLVGTAIMASGGQQLPPSVSAMGTMIPEPSVGSTPAVFTVSVSPPPTTSRPVTVRYATADGTATAANSDYQPASGVLTFDGVGPATKYVQVSVLADAHAVGLLTFFLTLATTPANATLVEGQVQAYILAPGRLPTPKIQHVVIIDQENHSFDNVLGRYCFASGRCDGATSGKIPGGGTIPLSTAADKVAVVAHSVKDQQTAVDGGKMDGFATIRGCTPPAYGCYTQYDPSQIANLSALASAFAVSDHTFQLDNAASWGSHLDLVATTLNGFDGNNPAGLLNRGWGCDSGLSNGWTPPASAAARRVPSCIPLADGLGAFQPTPVTWVPTIMDRLDAAGLSWHIYAAAGGTDLGYSWATCPSFADCLYTSQASNLLPASQVAVDARAGNLPAMSIVTPLVDSSQHNAVSMIKGDNWIGQVVSALEAGPDWQSTAVFITYDDCGCFYDHVPPPPGLGIRVPMVIIGPYVRPGFTDSGVASYSSMLAFVEHNYGLPPLGPRDQSAYDYANSFNFAQAPLAGVSMIETPVPAGSTGDPAASVDSTGT